MTADRHRWLGVLSLLFVVVIAYVDRVNMAVLIVDPDFLRRFGLAGDRAGQGALMSVFLFGYGVAALLLTPFYEAFLGARRGLLASLLAWAVLTALAPLAGSLFVLLTLRAVLGASEGPLFSLKTMFIRDRFGAAERGKPNAVSSMGVSLGLAVGFPLVSGLLHAFGWAASFQVLAAINLLAGLPLIHFFIRPADAERRGRATPARHSLAAVARGAWSTPHLASILAIEVCTLAYLWGSSSWLPSYLVHDRGLSIAQMGWVSSLPFLVALGANVVGGLLADAARPARTPLIFTAGGLLCALSVFGLVASSASAAVVACLLLASVFWGIQGAAIPTLIQRYSPAASVGTAYGFINGIGNMVSAFMPAAMGGLMKTHVASGFSLLIASQIGVAASGAWLAWRVGRRERRTPSFGDGPVLAASHP